MNERVKEIFSQALAQKSAAGRERFLAEACGEDAALRQEVESLLAAHRHARQFLQAPIAGGAASKTMAIPSLLETAENRIGRYKLLERIGEGGMGVVWMAEQEEPVRRRVALKIIKLGMDTKEVVARFEAERQALAMMDHPNIASVFDGGATETGRPYFVMELVKGIPITDYCNANNLPTSERLRLFMKICQAVQHAHQKGIIHRDLKPSNILVTVKEDRPVPKVIDFGVAKATQARLTEKTLFTQFRQLIGTPAYMSPEQAGLGSLDVDTRSDIYALGVLLYELLTDRTPFDTQKLLENGYDAVMRAIREEEPPKPSARLSTLLERELTATAQHRQADPPKLIHLIRGDLDWIVMKTLEKDRTRRYETVNGLTLDIQRHLNSVPVVARPPSNLYRFHKLLRRKRKAFEAVGLVAIAATAALIIGMRISQVSANRKTVEVFSENTPATTNAVRPLAPTPGKPEEMTPHIGMAGTKIAELEMAPPSLVSGVVLADDTGQPIAHALVRIASPSADMRYNRDSAKGDDVYEGQTDVAGRFRIPTPQKGTIAVDAFAPGYESAAGTPMWGARLSLYGLPFSPGQKQDLTIRLRPALYVAGIVVDEAGHPFPGAHLSATMVATGALGFVANTSSDRNGHFEIFDFRRNPQWLSGAKGQLTFTDPAMLRSSIDDVYPLSDLQRKTLRVTLRRGHDVTGHLTSADGQPVTGLEVEAIPAKDETEGKQGATDSKGRFVIQGLPDGELLVRAHSLTLKQKIVVRTRLSEADRVVDLRLAPIVLENPPRPVSLFGMQLADATPELRELYDQDESRGVVVLDAGTNCERLGISGLAEGCRFWMVGDRKFNNLHEMVSEMLQIIQRLSVLEGRLPEIRVVYTDRGRHGTDTEFLKLTENDVHGLMQFAATYP